ncbi:LacI family transcriptional regulator [Kiritimatiella glycovorans]|uniref:LacI family transcriptional regulator n=1 Tax=Kiritimatiella glycovorans TaxID=1307763 RepID=A0A0G3EGM4_9BACT|nr:LacI family transcriptional regulator [Kiritimatiella glycovorans]
MGGNGGLVSDQIYDWLREQIETWDIDKPLPSQNKIMKDFGVSLASVNTAFGRLVDEGRVERHRGRGSFIARKDVRQYSAAKKNSRPKVVIVSYDYFSETIWTNTHLCDEFLDRAGYQSIQFKLKKTDQEGRVREFLQAEEGIAGVVVDLSTRLLHMDSRFLNSLKVPVVLLEPVDSLADLDRVHAVHPDYEQSGFMMAEELLKCGHRHIAYVGDIPENEVTDAHRRGILAAFREHKRGTRSLVSQKNRAQPGEYAAEAGYRLTAQLVREHPNVDGILFDSAHGAFAAIRALNEVGKRVPEDVSVIGEGDYTFARFCSPPITVTAFDSRERIRRAIDYIVSPEKAASKEVVVPAGLIRRNSVFSRKR